MRFLFKWFSVSKRISLSVHYLFLAFGIILLISGFSVLIGLTDYHTYQKTQARELTITGARIESILVPIFSNTYHIQLFMGQQIVRHGTQDLDYIRNLLKTYTDTGQHLSAFYTWTSYEWSDARMQVRTNVLTQLAKPIDLSDRAYIQKARQYPWQFSISEIPLIGRTSQQWNISIATGITSHDGRYLGAIDAGFNIQQLRQYLENSLGASSTSFALINEQGQVILSSSDNPLQPGRLLSNQWRSRFIQKMPEGLLTFPLQNQHFNYLYYRKLGSYPFYILTGYDVQLAHQHFMLLLMPRLLEFIGLSLLCLLLMLFFQRGFIRPIREISLQAIALAQGHDITFRRPLFTAIELIYLSKGLLKIKRYTQKNKRMQAKLQQTNAQLLSQQQELKTTQQQLEQTMQLAIESDAARERFIRQAHADLKTPINIILRSTQYLMTLLQAAYQDCHTYLMQIHQAALEVKSFTRSLLNPSFTKITTLIKETILIHRKNAMLADVSITAYFEEPLPPIYVDAFRLKQALVGLLSQAIEQMPKEGHINITCQQLFPIVNQTTGYLKITITDNGFGLNEQETLRLKARFAAIQGTTGIELEIEAIQQIIELHQGQLQIEISPGSGRKIIILLPYHQEEPLHTTDNIYLFPAKTH